MLLLSLERIQIDVIVEMHHNLGIIKLAANGLFLISDITKVGEDNYYIEDNFTLWNLIVDLDIL